MTDGEWDTILPFVVAEARARLAVEQSQSGLSQAEKAGELSLEALFDQRVAHARLVLEQQAAMGLLTQATARIPGISRFVASTHAG